jgi:putrescine transport system substrate-binding protein
MKKTASLSLVTLILCTLVACHNSDDNTKTQSASAAKAIQPDKLSNTKALKIYNWSDYVDPKTISEFEKKYGIQITYNYYDSDETLESKILTGQSGYDIVGPSNSFLGRQIKAGAYQPLNKKLLPNWKYINPKLLELLQDADPGNQYAIPNYWGMNTIAIDRNKVQAALGNTPMPQNEWDLAFNPDYTDKLKSCGISYMDSPVEMIPLALHYIGKDPNSQSKNDIDLAANVIKVNHNNVLRYSSSGYIDDLTRGDVCLAIGFGGDLNIAKRRRQEATGKDDIEVLVPAGGVSLWIDTFTIPKDATNIQNVYRYLNWVLDPKIAARNASFVTFAPASLPAKQLMKKEYQQNTSIFPSDEVLNKSYLVLPAKSETLKYELRLWQNIKAGK